VLGVDEGKKRGVPLKKQSGVRGGSRWIGLAAGGKGETTSLGNKEGRKSGHWRGKIVSIVLSMGVY